MCYFSRYCKGSQSWDLAMVKRDKEFLSSEVKTVNDLNDFRNGLVNLGRTVPQKMTLLALQGNIS